MPISRRDFLLAAVRASLGAGLAVAGTGLYATYVETIWLAVERVRVPLPHLPPAFEGYRIVQLTDLHLGRTVTQALIARAVDLALRLAPDLIVLTGDYVTGTLEEEGLVAELSRLAAPDGVWATLGNHDHWTDASGVRRVLRRAGIRELQNAHTAVQRGEERLYVAGVDDIWEEKHDLAAALDDIPDNAVVILLAHEPDYADEVVPVGRVGLQLSGHSHGGQVRLPLVGAPIVPYLGQKYPYGLRQLGAMWLYTSRGVGNLLPVRVNCRPEVAEITLTTDTSQG
jgi:predicted MPP superfamily phosphohydrolase